MNMETSIAKVDIDIEIDEALFDKWLMTRLTMLEQLGKLVIGSRLAKTEHGYHVWFEYSPKSTPREHAEIQFLLGDDQIRCKFNLLRERAGVFHQFNALFSKKHKKERKA